jgi:type II secretory pathway component PulF
MKDFMQMQVEASERLYNMMVQDHKERVRDMEVWADTSVSLMKKLDERDAEIKKLREEIAVLKAGK